MMPSALSLDVSILCQCTTCQSFQASSQLSFTPTLAILPNSYLPWGKTGPITHILPPSRDIALKTSYLHHASEVTQNGVQTSNLVKFSQSEMTSQQKVLKNDVI